MAKMKPIHKYWLVLAVMLIIAASLFAGCGGTATPSPGTTAAPSSTQPATTAKAKPLIRLYDGQWESLWIENAIAQYIIEKGYGYPTESVTLDTAVMQVSLPKGELDVSLETWTQNITEWYEKEKAAGRIERLSDILEGGPQFFMIPKWVHEKYKINTVLDMKNQWQLFKDPEKPTKGLFVNSKIGWKCTEINVIKMESYGLTENYNIASAGSAAAADAALAGAQKKNEPVFGYYWAPTAMMGMYDWHILEEPEYNEAVWKKITAAIDDKSLRPVKEACAYPSVPLPNIAWSGLRQKAPDVTAFIEKLEIGLEKINKAAAWSVSNEISDYKKTAVWFLKEYDSFWKSWVTTDAYNKIKSALAQES